MAMTTAPVVYRAPAKTNATAKPATNTNTTKAPEIFSKAYVDALYARRNESGAKAGSAGR